LAASSFTCLLIGFDLFLSTSIAMGRGGAEASECTDGGGWSGTASANRVGGGTIVGKLVSMTIRSGGCCIEAMRMTGLLVSSAVASAEDRGINQFATSNNTSSDAPTQAMYRPTGITMSTDQPDGEQTP
jgi:hypothetical protein